jgi:hypothetical protein
MAVYNVVRRHRRGGNVSKKKDKDKKKKKIWFIAPVIVVVLVAGAFFVQTQGVSLGSLPSLNSLGIDFGGGPATPTATPTPSPTPTPTAVAPPGEQIIGAIEKVGAGFWRIPGVNTFQVAIVPDMNAYFFSVLTLSNESSDSKWIGGNRVVVQRPRSSVGIALIDAPAPGAYDYQALANYVDEDMLEFYEEANKWTIIIQGEKTTITRIMRDMENTNVDNLKGILN